MVINQYDVFLVSLDPTIGHEISKSRPCVVVSPDEMNHNISTVIIAPMTTKSHAYPSRIGVDFKGKSGWVVLDQMRTIDKRRLIRKMGKLSQETVHRIKSTIREMLVD